jgi:hypothetical protein
VTIAALSAAPCFAQAHAAATVVPLTANAATKSTNDIPVPPEALPGTVVLMATGDIRDPSDQRDRHNWSDVVQFDGHGKAVMVSSSDEADPADTFAHASLKGNVRFLRASPTTDSTQYDPCRAGKSPGCVPGGGIIYDIHSSAPDVAPEPTSPTTLCLGILGVTILVINAWRSGQRRYE